MAAWNKYLTADSDSEDDLNSTVTTSSRYSKPVATFGQRRQTFVDEEDSATVAPSRPWSRLSGSTPTASATTTPAGWRGKTQSTRRTARSRASFRGGSVSVTPVRVAVTPSRTRTEPPGLDDSRSNARSTSSSAWARGGASRLSMRPANASARSSNTGFSSRRRKRTPSAARYQANGTGDDMLSTTAASTNVPTRGGSPARQRSLDSSDSDDDAPAKDQHVARSSAPTPSRGSESRASSALSADGKAMLLDKVNRYKKRYEALRKARKITLEENEHLKSLLEELSNAQSEQRSQALNRVVGATSRATPVSAMSRRHRAAEKGLLDDLEALAEEEDKDDVGGTLFQEKSAWTRRVDRVRAFVNEHYPLREDLLFIQQFYGSGIRSYFEFYRFLVVNQLVVGLIWSYMFIRQVIAYDGGFFDEENWLPKWSLFSQWALGGGLYVSGLLASGVFLVSVSLYRWVKDDRQVVAKRIVAREDRVRERYRFASLALNVWEFALNKERVVNDHRAAVSHEFHVLMEEDVTRALATGRSNREQIMIYARRSIGFIFNTSFLLGGWIVIIYATVESESLATYLRSNASSLAFLADYAGPFATNVINTMLPMVTLSVVAFEQWDDQATVLRHQMWRLYCGRQLNLFVNLVSFYSIANGNSFLSGIPTSFDESTYVCGEDAAAAGLFALVLSEFVFDKLVEAGWYATFKVLARKLGASAEFCKKDEFLVAESMIGLLYFQSVVWVALPLFPYCALVGALLLYLNFKFQKFLLVRWRAKPASTWSAADTVEIYNQFYNLTLLMGLGSFYYFLATSWDCQNPSTSAVSGPFSTTTENSPWTSLEDAATENSVGWLYSILTSTVLYVCVGTLLLLALLLQRNKVDAYRKVADKTQELQWKIEEQARTIDAKTQLLKAAQRVYD